MCPDALKLWFDFNDGITDAASGISTFSRQPDRQKAANRLAEMFRRSIDRGNHKSSSCPVLKARVEGVPNPEQFTNEEHARMMISIFWAAQGNTLPLSFWLLAHILKDPDIKAKAVDEIRKNGKLFETHENDFEPLIALPYITSCLYEVLRLYTASMSHRHAVTDFGIRTASGKKYKIPKGDMVTISGFALHRNDKRFPDPEKYNPERWMQGLPDVSPMEKMHSMMADSHFLPFSKGVYSCSGKHLAQMEIPTLVALLLREFDLEMADPLPEPNFEEILGSAEPKAFPFCPDIPARVKFSRVRQSNSAL